MMELQGESRSQQQVWSASAPVRADLAGGTLDLWPLGLFHPGAVTVAVAVSLRVSVEAGPPPARGEAEIVSRDLNKTERFRVADAIPRRGPLLLLRRIVRELASEEGASLVCYSPVRAGSGLGTSSALGVAAAAALVSGQGGRPRRDDIVALVRDLEARELGIPTGTQDHEAAWRGGVVFLEHRPGGVRVTRQGGPLLAGLAARLLLVDSGAARSSGPSNWDMFRRRIEGEAGAVRALARVARAGNEASLALERQDWRQLGRAMRADLDARREWSPLVVTPALANIFGAARKAGALGYKVCGAGGGGFAAVLCEPGRREVMVAAIREAGGRPASARPTAQGLGLSRPP
jgi:D-glycero-alpha-D-manno-heptose-7-phosphate kinase